MGSLSLAVFVLAGAPALALTAPPPTPEDVAAPISGQSAPAAEAWAGFTLIINAQ